MIRNKDSKSKYLFSFLAAIVLHAAILAFVKGDLQNIEFLNQLSQTTKNLKTPLRLDQIKIMKPEEVEPFRRVGVKNGKKKDYQPDLSFQTKPQRQAPPTPQVPTKPTRGAPGAPQNQLSMANLAPDLPGPKPSGNQKPSFSASDLIKAPAPSVNDSGNHFYFNPKKQSSIPKSNEQEIIKREAARNYTPPPNRPTQRISNLEIRSERPEGISEDELNSDEKANYSFYVRMYTSYASKIEATFDKVALERPGIMRAFDKKDFLLGKVDYDEEGNIMVVKILKSSTNDDLHYFFEETLKQLNLPNPPKSYKKGKKFSIFYQININ